MLLQDWESFLKVCFTGKNKTMRSLFTLKTVLARTKPPDSHIAPDVWKETVVALLDGAGLTTARANAMTLQQFLTLYRAFVAAGTRFRSFEPAVVQSDDNDAE